MATPGPVDLRAQKGVLWLQVGDPRLPPGTRISPKRGRGLTCYSNEEGGGQGGSLTSAWWCLEFVLSTGRPALQARGGPGTATGHLRCPSSQQRAIESQRGLVPARTWALVINVN